MSTSKLAMMLVAAAALAACDDTAFQNRVPDVTNAPDVVATVDLATECTGFNLEAFGVE